MGWWLSKEYLSVSECNKVTGARTRLLQIYSAALSPLRHGDYPKMRSQLTVMKEIWKGRYQQAFTYYLLRNNVYSQQDSYICVAYVPSKQIQLFYFKSYCLLISENCAILHRVLLEGQKVILSSYFFTMVYFRFPLGQKNWYYFSVPQRRAKNVNK